MWKCPMIKHHYICNNKHATSSLKIGTKEAKKNISKETFLLAESVTFCLSYILYSVEFLGQFYFRLGETLLETFLWRVINNTLQHLIVTVVLNNPGYDLRHPAWHKLWELTWLVWTLSHLHRRRLINFYKFPEHSVMNKERKTIW